MKDHLIVSPETASSIKAEILRPGEPEIVYMTEKDVIYCQDKRLKFSSDPYYKFYRLQSRHLRLIGIIYVYREKKTKQGVLYVCLSLCFTSKSTAMVMLGLLPKVRMPLHPTRVWFEI